MSDIISNTTFTLDGVANFNIGGDVYSWGGGTFFDYVGIWAPGPANVTLTINLAGSDWYLGALRIDSDSNLTTIINDTSIGANPKIEYLHLNSTLGSSTVTLTHTTVESITGSDVVEKITTGDGWVGSMSLYGGDDVVTIGTGESEAVNLGAGNNTLNATGWVGTVIAFQGNDTAHFGAGGADSVVLGNGNNTITTGSGWVSSIETYNGNDTVSIGSGGGDNVAVSGGTNKITTIGWVGAIQSGNGNDTISTGAGGVDTIVAGNGNNIITTGTGWVSAILAFDGADRLSLGGDVDLVNLGGGNDVYNLANHFATIFDAGGIDTITSTISRKLTGASLVERLTLVGTSAINGEGNDLSNLITGNNAANTLLGHLGNDTLNGSGGNDTMSGNEGNDALNGGLGNDKLFGNAGNDTMHGNEGIDTLSAGIGNDRLFGDAGNDTLFGDLGKDTMTGGAGDDIFRFTAKSQSVIGVNADIITDFDDSGNDRMDLSSLFGPAMAYRHNGAFTGAGQVRINDVAGADVVVEVNIGGTLAADFSIRLTGTTLGSMAANDFFL